MPTPTQLNLTTFLAIAGLLVALLSLYLTVRRDRAAGRVGVRMVIEAGPGKYDSPPELRLTLSNSARRTVTVQRAGLSVRRWRVMREEFKGWALIRPPDGGPGMFYPFYGGLLFEPGDPALTITSPLYRVRGACFPEVARWLWCEDSIGGVHWKRIPREVRAAISATKRRKVQLRDEGGYRSESVEVEDSEPLNPGETDVDSFGL